MMSQTATSTAPNDNGTITAKALFAFASSFSAAHCIMSEEDQLQEYESQLADIEELLQADPTDEGMLKLKSDLVELIALTKEEQGDDAPVKEEEAAPPAAPVDDAPEPQSRSTVVPASAAAPAVSESIPLPSISVPASATSASSSGEPPKKKLKKLKDFEAPAHLQVQEGDNEKETNRKKRAVKALKQKHREKQREYESVKKQQSWQNFSKKKGSKKKKSIFATQDGTHAKVGVVSGGSMTEFGERKRHKYED